MRNGPSWRALEFGLLFIVLPLGLGLWLPAAWLPQAFLGFCLLGLMLLGATREFRWRELGPRWRGIDWRHLLLASLGAALALGLIVWWLVPGLAFFLPERLPRLWLMIILLYPWLSALPQELVFRVLFFSRYGALFPGQGVALAVNAGVFGLAHLAYWNWVAVVLSAAGGLLFAEAYLRRGGFAAAVILHAVCGILVFTFGLGTFFYHGAIPGR